MQKNLLRKGRFDIIEIMHIFIKIKNKELWIWVVAEHKI
jgi:hypothetical protein